MSYSINSSSVFVEHSGRTIITTDDIKRAMNTSENEETDDDSENEDAPVISFNASGWLMIFQSGVVAMLQEATELGDVQLHGTSAGATVSAAILCGFPGQQAAEAMCQDERKSRQDFKAMVPLMKAGLERLVPTDAAELVNGRLSVVCTEVKSLCPLRFDTAAFRQFACRDDVVGLLSATAHVPVLGGYLPHLHKGRWLYDGLFTDTHPLSHDKSAFKVSWTPVCACGCTDGAANNPRLFAPGVNMPLRWCALPPDDTTLRLIFLARLLPGQSGTPKARLSSSSLDHQARCFGHIWPRPRRERERTAQLRGPQQGAA